MEQRSEDIEGLSQVSLEEESSRYRKYECKGPEVGVWLRVSNNNTKSQHDYSCVNTKLPFKRLGKILRLFLSGFLSM